MVNDAWWMTMTGHFSAELGFCKVNGSMVPGTEDAFFGHTVKLLCKVLFKKTGFDPRTSNSSTC